MRRRRFVLLLRAMAIVPAPLTTMCGHQTRKAEEVQAAPPVEQGAKAARSVRQPIGGVGAKAGRDPRPTGGIDAAVSKRTGAATTLSAGAR